VTIWRIVDGFESEVVTCGSCLQKDRLRTPMCWRLVGATRQQLCHGISEDEYVAVVTLLQRMASNLQSVDAK
jgi:hypothetical protein